MDFIYSLFFGAGVAGFSYTRLGRRAGYGNTQNVWTIVGVIFVISTLFFWTILKFAFHV